MDKNLIKIHKKKAREKKKKIDSSAAVLLPSAKEEVPSAKEEVPSVAAAAAAAAAAAVPDFFEKMSVKTDIQLISIYKSLKQNLIFYVVLVGCLYAFTQCKYNKSNFILAVISITFISFYGYGVHLVSHYLGTHISEMYQSYDNIFTRNKYINWLAHKVIHFGEFHARTHHDTEINKTFKNITLEFINNLVMQGGGLLILKYLLDLIDNRTVLLWAFFYATVHNINYNIVSPLTHQQHHLSDKTNYGIDIWDIIVGSKYSWAEIETHNHTAINLIVITAVIIYLSNKFKL